MKINIRAEVHPDDIFATQVTFENGILQTKIVTKKEAYLPLSKMNDQTEVTCGEKSRVP